MTLQDLIQSLSEAPWVQAECGCQIKALSQREGRTGKPFFDMELSDGTAEIKLKVWDNHPAFVFCKTKQWNAGQFIQITGEFGRNQYGVDPKEWSARPLTAEETEKVLAGSPERIAKLNADLGDIARLVASMKTPCLRCLCDAFLQRYHAQFLRAAAARGNHHARRGGLVEHVAGMMRSADALCAAYPQLNRSLILTGALFHDVGKLWENQYESSGFVMPFSEKAELFGHIAIGVQVARSLWESLRAEATVVPATWNGAHPFDNIIVDHLCHLILSHHGTKEWGSPVEPKTPEAQILHFVDNIDAKLEMMRGGYESNPEISPGVFDRVRPLGVNLVRPLKEEP